MLALSGGMDRAQLAGGPWHYPVLLKESLEYLAIRPEGIYVDVTAGLGGHTRAIAERLTSGFVIASDRDAEAIELARGNTAAFAEQIRFFHGAFSDMPKALSATGAEAVDGVLADSGRKPLSIERRRAWVFVERGWAAGYADGSQPEPDRGGSCQ